MSKSTSNKVAYAVIDTVFFSVVLAIILAPLWVQYVPSAF